MNRADDHPEELRPFAAERLLILRHESEQIFFAISGKPLVQVLG